MPFFQHRDRYSRTRRRELYGSRLIARDEGQLNPNLLYSPHRRCGIAIRTKNRGRGEKGILLSLEARVMILCGYVRSHVNVASTVNCLSDVVRIVRIDCDELLFSSATSMEQGQSRGGG